MAAPETRRSFGPLLAIIFVGGAIYATIANNHRPGRLSSPSGSVTKQSPVSNANQKTLSVADVVRTVPPPQQPITHVPLLDAPPVQSLETPSSALVKNWSSPTQTGSSNLVTPDFVAPAPGCKNLPTYESVKAICGPLGRQSCAANQLCRWSDIQNDCHPDESATASSNPLGSPGDIDYIEAYVVGGKPNWLERGSRFFDRRQYAKAISAFTAELKTTPNSPLALMSRALAYERIGERARAITDYCRVLVVYSMRERRVLALARIADLNHTQPEGARNSTRPPDDLGKKDEKPGLATPLTGDIQPRRSGSAIAPFSIQTKSGSNYLVKLVNVKNSKDQIWIFVRGGEPYSTKVPVGNYILRVAIGYTWYGREDLFGSDTHFFRLRSKRGSGVSETPVLEFKKERNRTFGHTLSFEGSVDGNMEQEAMTRAEFDAN